jgi:flagellar biosynthesis chaperone FliJ
MSNWAKVESKYKREVLGLKQAIPNYEYWDKYATQTDKKLRQLLVFNLREIKTVLSDLMMVAHKETDDEATELKRIRDDLDLAIDEIESLNYWKFPDTEGLLEKIFKADLLLVNRTELMKKAAKNIQSPTASSDKGNIQTKLEALRKTLSDSRAIFLERAEIIKIRK